MNAARSSVKPARGTALVNSAPPSTVISERYVDPDGKALDIGSDVVFAAHLAALNIAAGEPLDRDGLAYECWKMLRDDVAHEPERRDQMIRLPWVTLAEGRGDCKSEAVLIAGVCAGAGCNVVLRMICHPGEDHYGHVYAVVDGVPVDPSMPFGEEMKYAAAQDVPVVLDL